MNTFKFWLRVLTTPGCWFRLGITNKQLSKYINEKLDANAEIILLDEYLILLGDKLLWIRNYPYSFGWEHPIKHNHFYKSRGIPDRKTVFRLYDVLMEKIYNVL